MRQMNKIRKKFKEKIRHEGLSQIAIAESIRLNKASMSLFLNGLQNLNGPTTILALEYLYPNLKEEIEKW